MRYAHLLLAGALLGCSADPLTELVVVINSDMDVPAEFDGFRVMVTSTADEVSTDALIVRILAHIDADTRRSGRSK